jgi:hypothetical protein
VAPPLPFSAFKVSAKNGLFLGQMARMPFEWSLKGYIRNDPRISQFFAVKNFCSGGIFLDTLFFAVEKRVSGLKGFKSKTIMDDGAKRDFNFL